MRSLLAILVTCAGLVACNDHGAAALTAIKDKVCACKTASCAEQEMQRVPQSTIASNHRTQLLAREMLDCFAKLQAGERPSTDPDEEGAAAAAASGSASPGASATAPGASAIAPGASAAAPAASAKAPASPAAPAASAKAPARSAASPTR